MNTDYWLALDEQHMTFAELIPVFRFHRSLLEPRVDSASGCEQVRSKPVEAMRISNLLTASLEYV